MLGIIILTTLGGMLVLIMYLLIMLDKNKEIKKPRKKFCGFKEIK